VSGADSAPLMLKVRASVPIHNENRRRRRRSAACGGSWRGRTCSRRRAGGPPSPPCLRARVTRSLAKLNQASCRRNCSIICPETCPQRHVYGFKKVLERHFEKVSERTPWGYVVGRSRRACLPRLRYHPQPASQVPVPAPWCDIGDYTVAPACKGEDNADRHTARADLAARGSNRQIY
jgi:hypothetical protein